MNEGNLDQPRSDWEETPELTEKGTSWSENIFHKQSKGLLAVPFSSLFYSHYGCKLVTQQSCAYM